MNGKVCFFGGDGKGKFWSFGFFREVGGKVICWRLMRVIIFKEFEEGSVMFEIRKVGKEIEEKDG